MLREWVASIPEGYQCSLAKDLLHAFSLELPEGLEVELLRSHMAKLQSQKKQGGMSGNYEEEGDKIGESYEEIGTGGGGGVGRREEGCGRGVVHLVYWMVIGFLVWRVVDLGSKEGEMKVILATNKEEMANLKTANQLLTLQQEQLRNDLSQTTLTASSIRDLSIQQHYLSKIQNMQGLAQSQRPLKQDQKLRTSYLLSMNNIKLTHQNVHINRELNRLLTKEYERLSKVHDFTLPEKPFCIVVPTLNNAKDFRYYYNLKSIFGQNYTNYKVVIIDDASTDNNFQLIQQYLKENPVDQEVILVKNKERMLAIANIYKAATEYCHPHDILALVDGDDELLGINVFKVFNSVYTLKGLEVMYSNIIINDKGKEIRKGWSSGYSDIEKRFNKYRDSTTRMFPLRTFNVSTFLKIRLSDLKDNDGNWFISAYDQTICPQVLQLSCGKNQYIDEYFYLYNFGLGNNDVQTNPAINYAVMGEIQRRKKYQCNDQ